MSMAVTNVALTSIDARRMSDPEAQGPQVRVDHNSTVTMVQKESSDVAAVEFRYTASYGGVGNIQIEGALRFQGDAVALESQWSQESEMPTDVASEIHTAVMRACVPEAVGLAKDLNLPPPIPLPQVEFEGEGGGGGGGPSPGREVM
jgi:hypothetical protein